MFRNLRELYNYRALIWALSLRYLSLRYRGSLLGFLWSFLNPLCLMLVYMVVFKYYIRFDRVDNYTIFLFCGLLPWLWLSSGLNEGASSIVSGGSLITKSMFPAHVLPTVAVITSMFNFLFSLPLLLIFMLVAGLSVPSTVLLLPFVVFGQFVFLLGAVLCLSALNVHFRDTQHIIANLLTLLFFLCPIVYPREVVPENLKFTLDLNPLAQLTGFYHSVILEGVLPSVWSACYFAAVALLCFVVGNLIYNYYRESFAELL